MEEQKSCGAVVYALKNGEVKFLSIQSRNDGYWGFPKGHTEDGESEMETALREIYEETGLEIKMIEGFKEKVRYIVENNINKTVVYFLGETEEIEVKCQEEEVMAYKWGNYDECMKSLTYDNIKEVLKKAFNWMKRNNII